jgi:hypothetical protein
MKKPGLIALTPAAVCGLVLCIFTIDLANCIRAIASTVTSPIEEFKSMSAQWKVTALLAAVGPGDIETNSQSA